MKKNRIICIALSVCFTIILASMPQAVATEVDFEIDYVNRYIWRGFDLNPDNKFVIQPSIDFSFGDSPWSINLWYSHSSEDKELNELDLTLNYDFASTSDIAVSAGVIHYGWYWVDGFKSKNDTTVETYLTLAWENTCLSPELSFYHDCQNGNGLYAQLALSKEFKLSESQNVELESSIGYNQKQWISRSGFSDINARLLIPLEYGDTTITPFAGITWVLLDDVDLNPGVSREYWLGVNLSF